MIYSLGLLDLDFELAFDKIRAMSVELNRVLDRLYGAGYGKAVALIRPVVEACARDGDLPLVLERIKGEATAREISLTKGGKPYLDQSMMQSIAEGTKEPFTLRDYASSAWWSIEEYGNDGLAHLCLPVKPWYLLSRRGIHTISDLEQFLAGHDGVVDLRGFGKLMSDRVVEGLKDFKRSLEAAGGSTQ